MSFKSAKCAFGTEGLGNRVNALAHAVLPAAVLAAAFTLVILPVTPVAAQSTVAPTCPAGFIFSGGTCVRAAPAPTCPDGFVFSGGVCAPQPAAAGPWVFLTKRALGVTSATELDGAVVCLQTEQSSGTAITKYFADEGMTFEPLVVNSESEGVDTYLRGACDAAVLADSTAVSTLNGLEPPGDHMLMPEKVAGTPVPQPRVAAVPAAPAPPAPPPVVHRAAPQPQPRSQPITRTAPTRTRPTEPLALSLQRELKRLNCLTGSVDGIWGRGSRAALERFSRQAGLRLGREPSQEALTQTRATEAGYCPPVRTASRPANTNQQRRSSASFDIRDGYDLPGNDSRRLRGKVSYETCLSACENDGGCGSFTYNTSARVCFLKFGVENWTRFGNAISGVRLDGGFDPIQEEEEEFDPVTDNACFIECDRGQNSCINALMPSGDGADDHHFTPCSDEFDACAAPCAFARGDCFTYSDGSEVCP
jgi:peptidoglycan hydrolase-like protein with peptidoglycan-binding domain